MGKRNTFNMSWNTGNNNLKHPQSHEAILPSDNLCCREKSISFLGFQPLTAKTLVGSPTSPKTPGASTPLPGVLCRHWWPHPSCWRWGNSCGGPWNWSSSATAATAGKSWWPARDGARVLEMQSWICLVVEPYPSEKYQSQLGWLFPIHGKMKNVPNHQPVNCT